MVIHVAAGCFPPTMPLLVSHPLARRLPTWFRWSDLFGRPARRAVVDDACTTSDVRRPIQEEELWS